MEFKIMNWKNTTENLIITIISFIVGAFLGYHITYNITNKIIKSNQKIIIESIKKPTNSFNVKNKKGILDIKNLKNLDEDSLNESRGWFVFGKRKDKR